MLRSAQELWPTGTVVEAENVGLSRALLKFKSYSVCEVFGYLLAEAIGLRVPPAVPFWTPDSVDLPEGPTDPGRIGIFIEYFADWRRLRRPEAAALDPVQVPRALTLCAFDRSSEWGEFGEGGKLVYFVDLERTLPCLVPERLLTCNPDQLSSFYHQSAAAYARLTLPTFREVVEEAEGLGMEADCRDALERLRGRLDSIPFRASLEGHPIGANLAKSARDWVKLRLDMLRPLLSSEGDPA